MKKPCSFLSVFYCFTLLSMDTNNSIHTHTIPPEIIAYKIVPHLITMPPSSEGEQEAPIFNYLSFIYQNEVPDIKNVLHLSITSKRLYNLLQQYRIHNMTAENLLTYIEKKTTKKQVSIFKHSVDYKKYHFLNYKIQKGPLVKHISLRLTFQKNPPDLKYFFRGVNKERKNDILCTFALCIKSYEYMLDFQNKNFNGETGFDFPLEGYEEIVSCIKEAKRDFNLSPLINYTIEYIKKNSESNDNNTTIELLSCCYKFLQNAINKEKNRVNQNEILIDSDVSYSDYEAKNLRLVIRLGISIVNNTIPSCLLREAILNSSNEV